MLARSVRSVAHASPLTHASFDTGCFKHRHNAAADGRHWRQAAIRGARKRCHAQRFTVISTAALTVRPAYAHVDGAR